MLIDLKELCKKYDFIPKGVIHIGAHKGEERTIYDDLRVKNIIWVEANPFIYQELMGILKPLENHKGYNYLITDVDDVNYDFLITNNGQSSSILELDKHKQHHPDVHVTNVINLKSIKIDTLIEQEDLDIQDFDFINLDIQGAELLALKGFSEGLKHIKYVYTEVNTASVYKNCALIEELDEYLKEFGFKRVETSITGWEWGDAFYIKE